MMRQLCHIALGLAVSMALSLAVTLPVGAAAAVGAATSDLSQHLRPDHPEVYTVVKGDTLWDISGRFLQRPWLWPDLWRVNPQIENPHLIYPGDRIALVWVDGQPQFALERGNAGRTFRMTPSDEHLMPNVRATPLESAIPAIRLDAIAAFLVPNRVVAPAVLDAAPYVIQGESERLVLGAGDRLYVRGILADGDSFSIMRKGPLYVDPQTKEVLGREATYVGLGRVVGQERDVATLAVSSSREEVHVGDRVLPIEERRLESIFYPRALSAEVGGEIISVFGGVTQVGQYDVVVINRGEREGLEPGIVFAVHKRGALARDRVANQNVRLPSERAGLVMVFRTFEKLSYGLVLETERPLAVSDQVRNP
jgi:hypothetical protein